MSTRRNTPSKREGADTFQSFSGTSPTMLDANDDDTCVGIYLDICRTGVGFEVYASGIDNPEKIDAKVKDILFAIAAPIVALTTMPAYNQAASLTCLSSPIEPTDRQSRLIQKINAAIRERTDRYYIAADPSDDWGFLTLHFN